MTKKALVTGITGQDGAYLAKFLLDKGYEVIGTRRGKEDAAETPDGAHVVYGDINDGAVMLRLMETHKPDEVYNLAAVSHVGDSFNAAASVLQTNAVGAANVADAACKVGAKLFQASTSEGFGPVASPMSETTPMQPQSPYGVSKLAAHWMARSYRQRGHHATNGILFNHESPRRGGGFVSQKIARGVAAIHKGQAKELMLGNLDAKRDWGHARDYCRGMWMLMQQPADDYVLATGELHSVRKFCDEAFRYVGLEYAEYVTVSPGLLRPLDAAVVCGDASKANALGWFPEVTFRGLVRELVEAAL
jgi:GDPmannose 4,6-dehydratase